MNVRGVKQLKQAGETYLGVLTDSVFHLFFIGVFEINKGCFKTLIFLCDTSHVTECSSIYVIHADDMGIGTQGLKDRGGCSRSRGKSQTVCTTRLKRSKSAFKSSSVGVARSGILKALSQWEICQEQIKKTRVSCGRRVTQRVIDEETYLVVTNTILLVCGAQGDRGNNRTSVRIWIRPNMDSSSAKAINNLLIKLFELGVSMNR